MSNNTVRIISGLVMVIILGGCIYQGAVSTLCIIGILGPFIIDELIVNFYNYRRFSSRYLLAQAIYLAGFYFFNFYQVSQSSFSLWISLGIVLNILLLGYLFLVKGKSERMLNLFRATSWITGLFILIPILCLAYVIHFDEWRLLLINLIILNFMVDTAAYFSGRKFGKHKLWEAVSPKKTVEGALGGVICSVIATSFFWNKFLAPVSVWTVLVFTLIACSSQVGDLIQSKLKRQFDIKDSSSLIPGHGGVYDRVDSLLFVAPIYAFYLMATFR